MVSKLDGHVFEGGVVRRQLAADLEHVLTEQCHPGGAVSLFQVATSGQLRAAVENADVVEAQKAAFKDVLAEAVLAVDPPAEIEHQLRKRSLEKLQITFALESLLGPVLEDRGPGMNGWVHIAEVPLVGRDLTRWMQE